MSFLNNFNDDDSSFLDKEKESRVFHNPYSKYSLTEPFVTVGDVICSKADNETGTTINEAYVRRIGENGEIFVTFIKQGDDQEVRWTGTYLKLCAAQTVNFKIDDSAYCAICSGCGEEGCCAANHCKQHPNGKFCDIYKKDLYFGYLMFDRVYHLINKESTEFKRIFTETYKEIYG